MNVRVVFMGSPEFALPTLRFLAESYPIVGVVTQPDKPAGRGSLLTPPPVKILAQELGIEVIQPPRLREPWAFEQLQVWLPDLIVVAAFGQILRPNVLDLPKFGCINVHASLLPRWRGASPIQAAVLHGDRETGVTIMRMDAGMDTGPILSQHSLEIRPEDTAGSLSPRLAEAGANLLIQTLPGYLSGELQPQPQDSNQATYAPLLKKEDGQLDFLSQPAEVLARKVRAYYPWPGAYTTWNDQILKIHKAHELEDFSCPPGKTCRVQNYPAIGTTQGVLVLDEVQPAGKKSMPGSVFLQGARGWAS